ncbi:MAG TPA: glycosyltransferase family 4 protein, partial [Sphingomonas sp.]|nr:glycosyltransferase family 4 protein [Sphingomonas sp.]
ERVSFVRFGLAASAAGPLRQLGRSLRRLRALRSTIRRLRPDIVISFLTKVNVLTLLATRGLAIPVIVSERNNPRRQAANPAWNMAIAALYPQADAIVMQSEASLACLPRRTRHKAVVIPNPIATRPSCARPAESRVIAAVGRLCAQKGFDLLLPAFARAAADHPEWQLVIWGEGPDRAALAAQIQSLGLDGRVEMPGLSRDPGGWVEGTGLFVLSSRYEGFPNALGEAMQAGLPVIAFDCDFGPAGMLSHEVDGLLVPAENIEALAAALERLMLDPALRSRLGMAARGSSARFDPLRIIEQWSKTIGSIPAIGGCFKIDPIRAASQTH